MGTKNLLHNRQKNYWLNNIADGLGWSQLDSLQTDAYATGQALYALKSIRAIEMLPMPQLIKKASQFLLKHTVNRWFMACKDKVISVRALYESSGFPHGNDQFISAAGS